jgi:hypothetical protein
MAGVTMYLMIFVSTSIQEERGTRIADSQARGGWGPTVEVVAHQAVIAGPIAAARCWNRG